MTPRLLYARRGIAGGKEFLHLLCFYVLADDEAWQTWALGKPDCQTGVKLEALKEESGKAGDERWSVVERCQVVPRHVCLIGTRLDVAGVTGGAVSRGSWQDMSAPSTSAAPGVMEADA